MKKNNRNRKPKNNKSKSRKVAVKPIILRKNSRDVSIKHREEIANFFRHVTDGSQFQATHITINPGDFSAFPWLAGICASFEQWKLNALTVRYQPTCPMTTQGRFAMYIDYDTDDEVCKDMSELTTMYRSVTSPVYKECSIKYDLTKKQVNKYFVNDSGNRDTTSRFSDAGMVVLATEGLANNSKPGIVWLEYDIQLLTPQYSTRPVGGGVNSKPTDKLKPFENVTIPESIRQMVSVATPTMLSIKNSPGIGLTLNTKGSGLNNIIGQNPLLHMADKLHQKAFMNNSDGTERFDVYETTPKWDKFIDYVNPKYDSATTVSDVMSYISTTKAF